MPSLPDRIRLSLRFDPLLLQQDLDRMAGEEWISHFVKQNYSGTWNVLPLRGKAGATHPVMMIYADPTCKDFADTPFLAGCPYFQQVLARFACPLESVRLMRLTPGSEIKEHTDLDLDVESGRARMHIPITTNPEVDFYLNGTLITMAPGECWYLRLADPHRVVNRGSQDRVHLVIDATVNEWLEHEIRASAAAMVSG